MALSKKWRAGLGLLLVVLVWVLAAGEVKDWLAAKYHDYAPRETQFPAGEAPDQIVLTWSGEPDASQTVQWRMAESVAEGLAQFRKPGDDASIQEIPAERRVLSDVLIQNNPSVARFTAVLSPLTPDTAYEYRVGRKGGEAWSAWQSFRTAPAAAKAFSFFYLGDVQKKFDEWGQLLAKAATTSPEAAFCLLPGDLANQGNDRDDWDAFFQGAGPFFGRYPLVPAVGNHECPRDEYPRLYMDQFELPGNGPEGVPREQAYSLRYGQMLLVVLDTNIDLDSQRAWLDSCLSNPAPRWKLVAYHEPLYRSVKSGVDKKIARAWADVLDKHHVDMVFQGHDHAYLRTHPMRDGKIAPSPAEGTIYCTAMSGGKSYEQSKSDYAAVAFAETPTFQVISIETTPRHRLVYRAYDVSGMVRDEVVIEKP